MCFVVEMVADSKGIICIKLLAKEVRTSAGARRDEIASAKEPWDLFLSRVGPVVADVDAESVEEWIGGYINFEMRGTLT